MYNDIDESQILNNSNVEKSAQDCIFAINTMINQSSAAHLLICSSAIRPQPVVHRPSSIVHRPSSIVTTIHPSPSSSIHHSPSIVYHPPSIVHHPPSTVHRHRPSSPVHRPPSIVHRPSSTIDRPPSIVHRPSRCPRLFANDIIYRGSSFNVPRSEARDLVHFISRIKFEISNPGYLCANHVKFNCRFSLFLSTPKSKPLFTVDYQILRLISSDPMSPGICWFRYFPLPFRPASVLPIVA